MSSISFSESLVAGQGNGLDRLVGLCDEVSALVRTGLPLEESLRTMSRSRRGRIGQQLRGLADQLGTGTSLAEAVQNDPSFPPVFASVIEAGIKSGNLSGALDSISESVRQLRDTRLFLLRSSLYPMILFTTLWLVFSLVVLTVAPKFIDMFDAYGEHFFLFDGIRFLAADSVQMLVFTFAVPAVLWLLYFLWSIFSARNNTIQTAGSSCLFRWMPWVGSASIELQKACFARILSMLVRSSIPLDKAILLAAQSCNDRYWGKENLESLRLRIVQGQNREQGAKHPYPKSILSPLIEWSLGISTPKMLLEGIDHYGKIAKIRSEMLLAKCEIFLPAFLTFALAALIGLCYFLTILYPYIHILTFLAEPKL
jgi:type II secretory pathway component PulF